MTRTLPERFMVWRAGTVPVAELTYDDEQSAMRKAAELVREMPEAGRVDVLRLVARVSPASMQRGPPVVQRTEER